MICAPGSLISGSFLPSVLFVSETMAESVAQAAMGSNAKDSLNAGSIAGIVVGSVLFIFILISGTLYFRKWHRKGSHQHTRPTPQGQGQTIGMSPISDHSHAMAVLAAESSSGRAGDGNRMLRGEGLV